MTLTDLPTLNATLNAVATAFLLSGYAAIRRRRVTTHRACMLLAFVASTCFLVSYVIYHATVGAVPFGGQGPIRIVYFAVLITHVVLAALVPILAVTTVALAVRGRFSRHRRLARWTFPIWLYVSVTGIVVYLLLYQSPWTG